MSLVDQEGKIQVNYSRETTFQACKEACLLLNDFTIQKVDDVGHIIHIKSGMSLFSWGETMYVSVNKIENNLSEIFVSSTPKIGLGANAPGLLGDMGKNRKNIIKIQQVITNQLSKYPEEKHAEHTNQISIADEIKKLADLRDNGILTEQEFSERKRHLLNS